MARSVSQVYQQRPTPTDNRFSAIILYFILMAYVILVVLRERKPLGYLALAFVVMAGSQAVYMLANDPLCKASQQKVDGSFIATLLETVAVILLVVTWSSVTEGEVVPSNSGAMLMKILHRILGRRWILLIDQIIFTNSLRSFLLRLEQDSFLNDVDHVKVAKSGPQRFKSFLNGFLP